MAHVNWGAVLDHPEVVRLVAARAHRRAAGRLTREDALQEARVWVARAAARWRPEVGPLRAYLLQGSPRPRRSEPYSRPGAALVPLDEPAPRTGTGSADHADRRRSPGWGTWTVGDLLPAPEVDPSVPLDVDTCLHRLRRQGHSRAVDILWRRASGWHLEEVGERYLLSRERIRQLEARALKDIRKALGITAP